MMIFAVVLTLGCAFAIQQTIYTVTAARQISCQRQNDAHQVVRNILDASSKSPPLKATPGSELARVIAESVAQNKIFVREQEAKIPLSKCEGAPKRYIFFNG